jgi:uncharacterized protein
MMRSPHSLEVVSSLRHHMEEMYGNRLVNLVVLKGQEGFKTGAVAELEVLIVLQDEVDSWEDIYCTSLAIAALCKAYSVSIRNTFVSAEQFHALESDFAQSLDDESVLV